MVGRDEWAKYLKDKLISEKICDAVLDENKFDEELDKLFPCRDDSPRRVRDPILRRIFEEMEGAFRNHVSRYFGDFWSLREKFLKKSVQEMVEDSWNDYEGCILSEVDELYRGDVNPFLIRFDKSRGKLVNCIADIISQMMRLHELAIAAYRQLKLSLTDFAWRIRGYLSVYQAWEAVVNYFDGYLGDEGSTTFQLDEVCIDRDLPIQLVFLRMIEQDVKIEDLVGLADFLHSIKTDQVLKDDSFVRKLTDLMNAGNSKEAASKLIGRFRSLQNIPEDNNSVFQLITDIFSNLGKLTGESSFKSETMKSFLQQFFDKKALLEYATFKRFVDAPLPCIPRVSVWQIIKENDRRIKQKVKECDMLIPGKKSELVIIEVSMRQDLSGVKEKLQEVKNLLEGAGWVIQYYIITKDSCNESTVLNFDQIDDLADRLRGYLSLLS